MPVSLLELMIHNCGLAATVTSAVKPSFPRQLRFCGGPPPLLTHRDFDTAEQCLSKGRSRLAPRHQSRRKSAVEHGAAVCGDHGAALSKANLVLFTLFSASGKKNTAAFRRNLQLWHFSCRCGAAAVWVWKPSCCIQSSGVCRCRSDSSAGKRTNAHSYGSILSL